MLARRNRGQAVCGAKMGGQTGSRGKDVFLPMKLANKN
jgi:hypothetical protein